MKTFFMVTSAIKTQFGVFDSRRRFEQTLATIQSVREKAPLAHILLCDSSFKKPIYGEWRDRLLEEIDTFIDLSESPELEPLFASTNNYDIIKNYSEMVQSIKILGYVQSENMVFDRGFKLSGRYTLTENFNLAAFADPSKFYFAKRRPSQFPLTATGGLTEQFMSRLYSFPGSQIARLEKTYVAMLSTFVGNLHKNVYTDMEHSLFREFGSKPDTAELDVIGVCGDLAPNGVKVED